MSSREYTAVAACPFEECKILAHEDAPWEKRPSGDTTAGLLSGLCSPDASSVRLTPMARGKTPPRWQSSVNFHEQLFKSEATAVVCQFQAKARESLAIALSPSASYRRGRTFEVVFGSVGNTRTILRRRAGKTTRETSIVPSRVCTEQAWTSYWVCLVSTAADDDDDESRLYAGLGDVPGKQCIALLVDKKGAPTSESATPTNNGKETAAADETGGDPLDRNKNKTMIPHTHYVGFANMAVTDRQAPAALHVRHICLAAAPDHLLSTLLSHWTPNNLAQISTLPGAGADDTAALFREYQAECAKNKKRALRFGTAYQEPSPDAFMTWSQARKLRANPAAGFATGLNLQDPKEQAKQEARRQRFGASSLLQVDPNTGKGGGEEEEEEEKDVLPVLEAWDQHEQVRRQRTDPPRSLWKYPPADNSTAMEEHYATPPSFVPQSIHVFALDWSFKQMRTADLMRYFDLYGATYVEWLSDLSCNVQFQDQHSAARALQHLSQELPTPIPEQVVSGEDAVDLGAQGWRLGKTLLAKVSNDRYGRRGTTARVLLRTATTLDVLNERPSSWPQPPSWFSTKRVLGPGRKKRRRNDAVQKAAVDPSGEHPLLSSALSSGRSGGYSVEELEAERAQKRAKQQSDA